MIESITNGMKLAKVRSILNDSIATVNKLTDNQVEIEENIESLEAQIKQLSIALDSLTKRVEDLEKNSSN